MFGSSRLVEDAAEEPAHLGEEPFFLGRTVLNFGVDDFVRLSRGLRWRGGLQRRALSFRMNVQIGDLRGRLLGGRFDGRRVATEHERRIYGNRSFTRGRTTLGRGATDGRGWGGLRLRRLAFGAHYRDAGRRAATVGTRLAARRDSATAEFNGLIGLHHVGAVAHDFRN